MIDVQNKKKDNLNNVTIPITRAIIRKRKRRFIYYFLCILCSFISIRIILILYAISNFKFSEFRIKTISYDMNNLNNLFLDIEFPKVYSPLHVQLCEAECTIDAGYMTLNRVAEILIPNIELDKYKGVEISGNFYLKYANPTQLLNILSKRKNIVITYNGSIWFRFCFIQIKMSRIFTYRTEFDDSESSVGSFPFTIKSILTEYNEIDATNQNETIKTTFEIESYNVQIPNLLIIKTFNSEISLTNDLPMVIKIKEIDIENGIIYKPIIFSIEIVKEDINTFINFFEKIYCKKNLNIGFHKAIVNNQITELKPFNVIVKPSLFFKKDGKKNNDIPQEILKPFLSIKDVNFNNKQIQASFFLDLNLYPIVTQYTFFSFKIKEPLDFKLSFNGSYYGIVTVQPLDCKEFINLRILYKFIDVEMLLLDLNKNILQVGLDYKNDKSLLSCFCEYNRSKKETFIKINDFCLEKIKSDVAKTVNTKGHVIEHLIDSDCNDVTISSLLTANFEDKFVNYVYVQLPDINLKLMNSLLNTNMILRANNYRFYLNGEFSGIFNLISTFSTQQKFNYKDFISEIMNSPTKIEFVDIDFCYNFKIINECCYNNKNSSSCEYYDKIFDLKKYNFSFDELNENLDFIFTISPIDNYLQKLDERYKVKNIFSVTQNLSYKIFSGNVAISEENNLKIFTENKKFILYLVDGKFRFYCEKLEINFHFQCCDVIQALVQNNYNLISCSNRLSTVLVDLLSNLENVDSQLSKKFSLNEFLDVEVYYENFLYDSIKKDIFSTSIMLNFAISNDILDNLIFNEFHICQQKITLYDLNTDCKIFSIQNDIINTKNGKKLQLNMSFLDSIDDVKECRIDVKRKNEKLIWSRMFEDNKLLSVFRAFSSVMYTPSKNEIKSKRIFPSVNIDIFNLTKISKGNKIAFNVDIDILCDGWKNLFNSFVQNFLGLFYSKIPEFVKFRFAIPRAYLFTLGIYEGKCQKDKCFNTIFKGFASEAVYTLNHKNDFPLLVDHFKRKVIKNKHLSTIKFDVDCKVNLKGILIIDLPCSQKIDFFQIFPYSPIFNGLWLFIKNENPTDLYKKFSLLSFDFLKRGNIVLYLGFDLILNFDKNMKFEAIVNDDKIGNISLCNQQNDGYFRMMTSEWSVYEVLLKYLRLNYEENKLHVKCYDDQEKLFDFSLGFKANFSDFYTDKFFNSFLSFVKSKTLRFSG